MTPAGDARPRSSAARRPRDADPSASPAPWRVSPIARAIELWFPGVARDLPWRRERSGWHALVSETMLQQTQVARVVDAFVRFVARFPAPAALAEADEAEVLAHWQGLGYYRRARLLHAAARAIVERHDGVVPTDAQTLATLPGVGRYTAGAIASIVHGERAAIVDGNVRRVVARLRADDRADESAAWEAARALVEASRSPAALNEGLMELGATVCTPRAPRCDACPVARQCRARAAGRAAEIPSPRVRAERTTRHWAVVLAIRAGKVMLVRRGESGLYRGMLAPPVAESPARLDAAAVSAQLADHRLGPLAPSGAFRHDTTHLRLEVSVHRTARAAGGEWHALDELARAGLAAVFVKAVACGRP